MSTKIGGPLAMNTTLTNDTSSPAALTVTITLTSSALPHYLEAVSAGAVFSCLTATNQAYYQTPPSPATFICTGTLAAKSSNVITVSTGSMIGDTAKGNPAAVAGVTTFSSTVTAMPGNITASATAKAS